jgi:PKD repeat protein
VTLSANGMISSPGDIDTFAFIGGPGAVSFKVEPVAGFSNLDVATQVLDSTGKVLASANPVDQINATLTTNLPAKGLYYLSVTGAGKGDPLNKPGDGYTNYGSLGNYAVTGTGALTSAAPPKAMVTASATSGTAPMAVSFSAAGSSDPDGVIVAYQWNFGDGSPPVSGPTPRYTYTRVGTYNAVLEVTDNTGMKASKAATITVRAPGTSLPIYINSAGLYGVGSSNGVRNVTVAAEIVDVTGTPVAGAQVTGSWGPGVYAKGATSATSDARGIALFTASASSCGQINFYVTGVSKAGAVYTPSLNKTTRAVDSGC